MALKDHDFNGSTVKVIPTRLIDMPTYQRKAIRGWAEKVAAEWDSLLFIYPRLRAKDDGRYEVIDGHHTIIAAELRGHSSLPCSVFTGIDHKRAAAVYSDINTERKRLSPYDVYRADLEAGREWAETLRDVAERHGIEVLDARGPRYLRAISQCRTMIDKGWRSDLDDAIHILTETYDPSLPENDTRLERKMLMGVVDMIRRAKRSDRFDRAHIVKRLSKATYSRRGIAGIRLTPKALEGDYIAALIEAGKLEVASMTTGEGSAVMFGRALAIAVYGAEQARQLYS